MAAGHRLLRNGGNPGGAGCALFVALLSLIPSSTIALGEQPLRIATFQADVTPPLGTPLCSGNVPPGIKVIDRLSARGIVLLGNDAPIVLCAVDWVGIANGGHDAWRDALARAAGTTRERVAVHTLHQHDTPDCDFTSEALLVRHELGGSEFAPGFCREAMERTASAVAHAVQRPIVVTHIGLGRAKVDRVASSRRILGPDGKVAHVRFTSCKDPDVRAAPEGVIDPYVRSLSFWADDQPVVSLTWYATHPQSFYARGAISADFVGLARSLREATLPAVAHIHFNGAGGNIGAGKYNDGSPTNRFELARRLAAGMESAWDAIEKHPVTVADLDWAMAPVALPPREELNADQLRQTLEDAGSRLRDRVYAARHLVWLRRCAEGGRIDIACLRIGKAYVLHMPGELFVEYQLAAQAMRPDAFVAMAAYGDYGPGYIGTTEAYPQGGYETGEPSRTSPTVEPVLMEAMERVLARTAPAKQ